MEQEAAKVRNGPEDDWVTPANAFETHVGHFWGILDTRPYMRAKVALIHELSAIDARPAVELALAEAKDSLRLCRSDNVGIRDVMPTLMLLLGQFQEAYDFIKWYAQVYHDSHYDWGNMELPFLDVHDADMTEELPPSDSDIFFSSSLVYVKMHLAKGVEDAIEAHELAGRKALPALVTDSLVPFLLPLGATQSLQELKKAHQKLTRQLREAFSRVQTQNQHFWHAMLDPMPLIEAPEPEYYSSGDVNEIKVWIEQNAMLWRDHHEFIRQFLGM
ncbi:unnamed protein product [Phytophthora fragariaefolia]|uniref:Unnamed protein product n=1 Tax=Phytophthora fragariaefolia TaxID=1490495 RepID=A0A9W6TRI8_9STRA|nr:unnamed protein product [Phytophthora fragariaefolia]